ncbi:MAG: 3-phosphoshikimate 1-carboxyvinyltransferase [Treponema sp.]|nr:3-phosphoshikimate 1-carboxyvinyltransferase [Treponema sp.]
MQIRSSCSSLSGAVTVPGSKSHTIRALVLACLAEGTSHIHNPLPSADCLSTAGAVPLMGASISFTDADGNVSDLWTVNGAGKNLHLPSDVVNAGNSGSLLYFLSPIAATFDGWSVFTGDESLRSRPVQHVVDVLTQLGAKAYCAVPGTNTCPLVIQGKISAGTVRTEGSVSSQYITGLMLAALRLDGTLELELSDPKETPYLTMTADWLTKAGAQVSMSPDFHHITVKGPLVPKAFDCTIPSDWEAVAFPLIAALISDSTVIIEHIDAGGTQGDDAIVDVLKQAGADVTLDAEKQTLTVCGMSHAKDGVGRLTTEHCPNGELHVNLSGYPDAICALAAIACFIEGTVVLEDIAVCRRKETDRIAVLTKELTKLGAAVKEESDRLTIYGHSPLLADGSANPAFNLHGATVESYKDHRVAMSLACMGLGMKEGQTVTVNDAECCAVSFPRFFEVMCTLGASFK